MVGAAGLLTRKQKTFVFNSVVDLKLLLTIGSIVAFVAHKELLGSVHVLDVMLECHHVGTGFTALITRRLLLLQMDSFHVISDGHVGLSTIVAAGLRTLQQVVSARGVFGLSVAFDHLWIDRPVRAKFTLIDFAFVNRSFVKFHLHFFERCKRAFFTRVRNSLMVYSDMRF